MEALGTGRNVTADEFKAIIATIGKKETGGLERSSRRKLLFELLKQNNLEIEDPGLDRFIRELARNTEGYVGSDLELISREAGMLALREKSLVIGMKNFEAAKQKIHPTMNQNIREWYKKIQESFKGGLPKEVQPPEYQ